MKILKKSKKYVKFIKKLKKMLENIKKSKDLTAIGDFFFSLIIYGIIINIGVLIFGIKFNFINIISFGALFWFIENKIIGVFRRLWFRK